MQELIGKFVKNFTDMNGWVIAKASLEIFIIFVIIYLVLRVLQGTRGEGILRALAFIIVITSITILFLVRKLHLYSVEWIIEEFLPVFILPIIILFQQEFRRAIVRLGHNTFLRVFFKQSSSVITEIIKAIINMSDNRVGGLIAIEREVGLDSYAEKGTMINADITSDLIKTIFWPSSPLHDGAIIIRDQKIVAASCLFPLSENPDIAKEMGTRHRAGIGLTEETDAISIIISEETGKISVSIQGKTNVHLGEKELTKILNNLMMGGNLRGLNN
ncbi:MAG: diadenylate cyclase CdaA [Candidatus Anammoxibacter sp.]